MIEKPVSRLVQELDAQSFTVVGCACHAGLGAETMRFLRSGLAGAEGDFIAVVGDVVPIGRDPFYQTMSRFIDAYSDKPVHVLRCNHDGPDFGEYFGHANRAVISESFVLVMLDNSDRRFSDETLEFLRETMAIIDSRNVIVAFHVPPPNRISGNTMTVEEWRRFEDAIGVWRSRISLLVCGHEHCYYEDDIDGIRLVASGGVAGSGDWLERVNPCGCHALEISLGADECPVVKMRMLDVPSPDDAYAAFVEDIDAVARVYTHQCREHVSMRFAAEEARERGDGQAAHFYRAAAESALTQSRILHGLLAGARWDPPVSAPGPTGELLFTHALESARRTQIHTQSLLARMRGQGVEAGWRDAGYSLCPACAMLFAGREAPNYCPACGAPYHTLREVK